MIITVDNAIAETVQTIDTTTLREAYGVATFLAGRVAAWALTPEGVTRLTYGSGGSEGLVDDLDVPPPVWVALGCDWQRDERAAIDRCVETQAKESAAGLRALGWQGGGALYNLGVYTGDREALDARLGRRAERDERKALEVGIRAELDQLALVVA